jgi:hypothetical protein
MYSLSFTLPRYKKRTRTYAVKNVTHIVYDQICAVVLVVGNQSNSKKKLYVSDGIIRTEKFVTVAVTSLKQNYILIM